MLICGVCGSKDFFVESGFYYCSLCQSQLEDAREELNENNLAADSSNLHEQSLRKKRKHSSGLSKGDEHVSWEVYNFLLRGFVDDMISLGAKQDLKIVVLQLWTSYLSRLEIAFHGKSGINFGLSYIKRDVKLLTGVNFNKSSRKPRILEVKENKRKKQKGQKYVDRKLLTDLKDSEGERDMTISEKRKLNKLKRKLVDLENSQLRNEEDKSFTEASILQSQSQTLENLTQNERKDEASPHSKMNLSKHSKTVMNMFNSKTSDLDSSKRNEMLKSLMHNFSRSGCHMTVGKLFGLLQLGMMFSEQDAQISDMLRWITEGHITHEKYKSFLPEETSVNGLTIKAFLTLKLTNSGIRSSIKKLANVLSITSLPTPDFSKLTARYCQELQLPGELLELVHKLLVLCPPKSSFSDRYSFEARAMSYIIVALKLVFGLDGVTERTISNVADLINRKCNKGKPMKLFSWVEWMKFIECRKAVIANFHYPTRVSVCKELSIGSDATTFFNYWQNLNPYDDHNESTSKGIDDQIKLILDKLDSTSSSSCVINFPGSLTPLLTYSKELLEHHRHLLQPSVCKILKKQFTSRHLLLPSRYKVYEKAGIKINIQPSCLRKLEKVPCITLPCIPFVFHNTIIQTVIVKNKPEEMMVEPKPATSKKRKRSCSDDDLTKITNNLLKKRLIEVEEGKFKIDNCIGKDNEFSGESFILSEPYKHYWLLHGNFYDYHNCTVKQFDEISRKQFSSSFLWLLKECSRVINDFPRTLYVEVVSTETMLMNVGNE